MDPSPEEPRANGFSPTPESPAVSPKTKKTSVNTKGPGHDSMVTVRLSEPPALSVNTDLPTPAMPSRRSIFGPEYTPTSAVTLCENEEDVEEAKEGAKTEMEIKTPTTVQNENEPKGSTESVKDETVSDDTAEESDTDTEEVNWERLQKTENEQVKVKESDDNVRITAERKENIPNSWVHT